MMSKRKFTPLFIMLFLTSVWYGCQPATTFIGSWKEGQSKPKQFNKLGVVVLSPKVQNKATIESDIAMALRSKSIQAIATFDIFPFAGSETAQEFAQNQEESRAKIRERVNKFGLDGLLVVSLKDKEEEKKYHQGTTWAVSAPVYGNGMYGYNYGFPYDQYFYHTYTAVHTSGYYTRSETYFIETSIFDVATEEMIWLGQTKTRNPSSLNKESKAFADLIVSKILEENVLKP